MMRVITALLAAYFLVLSSGCRSPESHLYTLSASPTAATQLDQASAKLTVLVGPVSIPAMVDVPQIVVRTSANQVTVDEFNRWAAPLASNISDVVAENLAAMLGTSRVSSYQQVLARDPDFRVAIDVQTFDSMPGDAATLSAMWMVRRVKDGKSESGRTSVREPSPQKRYDALAAAHSRALSRMSRDIADAIQRLEQSPE
jgi:uncharacterized lipoprotein YmbA